MKKLGSWVLKVSKYAGSNWVKRILKIYIHDLLLIWNSEGAVKAHIHCTLRIKCEIVREDNSK